MRATKNQLQLLDQISTIYWTCPSGIWLKRRKMSSVSREITKYVPSFSYKSMIFYFYGGLNYVTHSRLWFTLGKGAGKPEVQESLWPVERRPCCLRWRTWCMPVFSVVLSATSVLYCKGCVCFFSSSMFFVLYSDGCIVLCSILQAVEAKQMQDEMAGLAGKPLKVKGGKTKVKKAQLPEVMPSAHGIRVVPRVTAEMKADAEKRAKKKVKVKSSKCLIFYYILFDTEGSP